MGSRSNSDDKMRTFPTAKQATRRVEVPIKQNADSSYSLMPKKKKRMQLPPGVEPISPHSKMDPKTKAAKQVPKVDLKVDHAILKDGSKYE